MQLLNYDIHCLLSLSLLQIENRERNDWWRKKASISFKLLNKFTTQVSMCRNKDTHTNRTPNIRCYVSEWPSVLFTSDKQRTQWNDSSGCIDHDIDYIRERTHLHTHTQADTHTHTHTHRHSVHACVRSSAFVVYRQKKKPKQTNQPTRTCAWLKK